MAIILTGLGNPGEKYEGTRHNIGFAVLDALAAKKGLRFETGRLGEVCKLQMSGNTVYLLKPNTFMNRSGDAVLHWMRQGKVQAENILVITDDIALPFGKIRIRPKGSSGGHNGLGDIEQKIQSQDYPRMRMGVGSDFPKGRQAEYVLGKFSAEDQAGMEQLLEKAAEACLCFCSRGLAVTMNQFNS
jgi:PTH1 family peptidyl-tRNA hydrolase